MQNQVSTFKGIVLAGGSGSRLYPVSKALNKHLLPVYDKPMVFYPLSILMLAGINDIAIVTTPRDKKAFIDLLGDGSDYGIKLSFFVQKKPDGISQAFSICKDFIGGAPVALILGDNIFYSNGMKDILKRAIRNNTGATIFCCRVASPSSYGIVEIGDDGRILSLEEKPAKPKSSVAVTGLYFYDNSVVEKAQKISPSSRGELEITDINNLYLEEGRLDARMLPRGVAWLDAGTFKSLNNASQFVEILEVRQGLKIACLEEIAQLNGWLSNDELSKNVSNVGLSSYGQYLITLSNNNGLKTLIKE